MDGSNQIPREIEDPGARRKLSGLLLDIVQDETRSRISVADLLAALQVRAFGALLLIFALPNVIPTPPGTSAVLGLPLLFLTAQMMLGQAPWLPRFIADRSMAREDLGMLIGRMTSPLARAERLLSPRLLQLTTSFAERFVGAFCLILAIVLTLPIPLGNMLPALAISVIALGILERDGLWIIIGTVIGFVSLIIVWGVIYALIKTILFLVANAFA